LNEIVPTESLGENRGLFARQSMMQNLPSRQFLTGCAGVT